MLTVLLAWMLMFFIFISFGDILLASYNKLCGKSEKYSILNTFLLGIPSLLIVLPLLHFLFPINFYTLLGLCLISLSYWFLNRKRILGAIDKIVRFLAVFSKVELLLGVLLILSFSFIASWGVLNYDAGCYHYQFLRWIEDYPTVVGLGNIEERLGFNSNYFILSAPFTMRFLLDEPLLTLQGLLVTLMFGWMLFEMVKSNYSFNSIFLFLLHLLLVAINILHFADSSTDVVPNQIVFYLVAYLVLHPLRWKTDCLLLFMLPIAIITLKLSLAVFALLSLVALFRLIQSKDFKSASFVVVASSLILVLWLIRNIILSGYLIFPMYELDFFNVDWKVPLDVAIAERSFIKSGALWQFKNLYNNAMTLFYAPEWKYFHTYTIGVLFVIIGLSIPLFIYGVVKNRLSNDEILLYSILLFGVAFSYISAPDFRFSYGLVFGLTFMSVCSIASFSLIKPNAQIKRVIASSLIILLLIHLISTFWILSNPFGVEDSTLNKIALKPRTFKEKNIIDDNLSYNIELLNVGVPLYVSDSYSGFTMYKIPSVPDDVNNRLGWRFQHYKNLEARGNSIKDGFRTKQ